MDVDYLKIGDKVYGISEIQAEGIDVNAELKEFYEQRHTQLADEFGTTLNDSMQQEWDTQIAHLRKFENKGSVVVPQKLFHQPIMVMGNANRLCEVRVITFAPNELMATMYWLRSGSGIDFSHDIWNGIGEHDVIITFKPSFSIPLILAYDKQGNVLYTPNLRTYHTMSGGSVCTGNHKASDFWKLDDTELEAQMNKINTFSPAMSTVYIKGESYHMRDLVTDDTIINVRRKGATEWRA